MCSAIGHGRQYSLLGTTLASGGALAVAGSDSVQSWPRGCACGTRPRLLIRAISSARFHDRAGQKRSYIYYEDEPGHRSAAKLLSEDEARRRAEIFLMNRL